MNKLYSLRIWMFLTAAFVLLSDYYTKMLAMEYLAPDMERGYPFPRWITVIPRFFDLHWAENTGGAFSLMHTQPWVILMGSGAAIVGIIIWALVMRQKQFVVQLAFGMIIGGAVGNIFDRFRYGYVIDFLDFYYVSDGQKHSWPTFNVADIAIVAGISLFVYLTMFTHIFDPMRADPQEPTIPEDAEPATD